MKHLTIALLTLLVLSGCAAMIYNVGDRENPSERFLSIDDGLSFYNLQSGNKAFAANIYVSDSYPFSTVYDVFGGFCYAKESTGAAEECALKQCLKNVNGINQFGGYGSIYKDCVLIRVNNESEYYYSSIEKFDEQTGNQTRTIKMNAYRYAEAEKRRIRQAELARFNAKVEAEKQQVLRVQQARQAQYQAYIDTKKRICQSYGFTDNNAIAVCVQQEVNNELIRLQNQQAYANQQSRANSQARWSSFNSYSRCLQNENSLAACSNAWNGYTPPKKTVCRYDTFGNEITSTCTTK